MLIDNKVIRLDDIVNIQAENGIFDETELDDAWEEVFEV